MTVTVNRTLMVGSLWTLMKRLRKSMMDSIQNLFMKSTRLWLQPTRDRSSSSSVKQVLQIDL